MLRTLSVFLALFCLWILLSGFFTPFLLAAGAGCSAAVLYFAHHMKVIDRAGHPVMYTWRVLISYWPWLIKEIFKSAWDVTCRVLSPSLPISPTLKRFTPSQQSEMGIVIHANSITLTPGTISIEVGRGEFLVHALTREGAEGLAGSEMDRRVSELERS